MAVGIHGLNFVEKVTERDIDFLLLEELQVSLEFREWFVARVFEEPRFKSHVGCYHSVVHTVLGESDLIFIFKDDDDTQVAIMIENKIGAIAQPNQGRRYIERGEKGIEDQYWQEYRTCLVAPRKYLGSSLHSEEYHCEIPYEEIMAFFASRRSVDTRQHHRARLMLGAVDQHRRGYQPKSDDKMTEFVAAYWSLAQASHRSLEMREPKPRAAGNTWINFYPAGFPKSIDVVHQLTSGFVKVLFNGQAQAFDAIEARYRDVVTVFPDLEIELTGKSVSVAIPVKPVKPLETSFDAVRNDMAAALDVADRLVQELRVRGFPS